MHLRALELVGSVKTEASMESEKASFGGPDWQEPAGVPKCFMGEPEQRVVRSVLEGGADADAGRFQQNWQNKNIVQMCLN